MKGKIMAKAKAKTRSGLHAVRTTINPGQLLHVDAGELLEFQRQGLIYSDDAPAPPATGDDAPGADVDNERGAS